MKLIKPSVSPLLFIFIILFSSGCTLSIIRQFEPGSKTSSSANPSGDDELARNMVELDGLGTGYDLVFTDPEDLSRNSVQNGSSVKPQVFLFEPDGNNFIDIKMPGKIYRRNLPKGVTGVHLSEFKTSSDARWVRTASDYQNSFKFDISVGGGVPDVASFTGSTSFKNVNENTRNHQNMYLHQDGSFEGHILALNGVYKQKLNPAFIESVNRLPDTTNTEVYNSFIRRWGTHYSNQCTYGGKCTYKFTFTQNAFSTSSDTETSFGIKAEAGAEEVKVNFDANMDIEAKSKFMKTSGAQNIEFISHGGSGARNFEDWSRDAMEFRVPIDISFVSYIHLLIPYWFPEMDPVVLDKKRALLDEALRIYFLNKAYNGNSNYGNFFNKKKIRFRATILAMEFTEVSPSNEKDATIIADKNNEIYGTIGLLAFDAKTELTFAQPVALFDLDDTHFLKKDEGTIIYFKDGEVITFNDKQKKIIHNTLEFSVNPTAVESGYLCLISKLYEKDIPVTTKFGETGLYSTDSRIKLTDASYEPQSIILTTSDGDVMTFRVKLEKLE